ncbi:polysaccharide deacetylase family protein [Bacillus sp. JCM 19041]|uniref:polysaccharide deacetylase family protein n=1 Tax=Bacillus sp. JCM 19041 TaxID=1460637 RepID=UPI0006D03031
MKRLKSICIVLTSCLITVACTFSNKNSPFVDWAPKKFVLTDTKETPSFRLNEPHKLDLSSYSREPSEWGEFVTGVKTKLDTNEKVLALTFDACGGPFGSEIDHELIEFLVNEEIPSTLFVNARWIDENKDTFLELATNPLFQIENHGTEHKPLSINGRSAWGIQGTTSPEEALNEIMINQQLIFQLTDKYPTMFRSGTAYFDDVSVGMLTELNLKAVNYSLLGDAGATYSAKQVENALIDGARPGAIALLHMNQPKSGTTEGIKKAIPQLLEQGFSFVQLTDYPLK